MKPTTWNEILAANNETQEQFNKRTEHDTDPQKADKELEMMGKATNPKGWRADFSKNSQKKWFPIFIWDDAKACFVFAYSAYDYTDAVAGLGPRLYFESKELSDHAGSQWIDTYNRSFKYSE
jgi:hypothetical protein